MQHEKSFVVWEEMVGIFLSVEVKKDKLRKIKRNFLKGGTYFLTIFYGRPVISIGILSTGSVALSLLFCCGICTKNLLSLPLFLLGSVMT